MIKDKKNLKGLKVFVDDEILELFDWLEINKGMSRTGAVRIGLRMLKNLDTSTVITETKKEPKYPKELEDDIAKYTANPGNFFCPNHGNKILSDCPCLENGEFVTGLKRYYGIIEE